MGCSASGAHSAVVPLESSSASSAVPKRLLEEYAVREQLGEGAFGVVYSCVHLKSGLEAAVKMVDKVETPIESIEKEVQMLKNLDHPNIVRFQAVYHEKCFICIVMDKYSGGDLIEGMQKHLRDIGKIDGRKIRHVLRQLISPVQYMHNKSIVHRDVKGDNYLLDRRDIRDTMCRVVLSDFGTARAVHKGERLHEQCGTKLFWSPEFYDRNYSQMVDVWAIGICVFGLLSGNFPFQDETEVRKKTPRMKFAGPLGEDFIKCLLRKVEKTRISANAALEHEYIRPKKANDVEQESLERMSSQSSLDQNGPGPAVQSESIHQGVHSRRRELLERMNERHRGKKNTRHDLPTQMRWFTIMDKNVAGLIYKFEWWEQKAAKDAKLLTYGTLCDREEVEGGDNRSPIVVGQMLTDHEVDTTKFGKGDAKSLQQLAAETRSGECRLMLDAADYKKLVRVVDVVLLRLSWQPGSKKDAIFLIEMGEKYPDGRRRDMTRMPGTKRRPWESATEAAKRMLVDLLEMGSCTVSFDLEAKEVFEEEFESPSFPGVRTVYRKEIVPCHVRETNPVLLNRFGLPDGTAWTAEDPRKNVKYLQWKTESEVVAAGVSFGDKSGENVSSLVHAPIGMGEEVLANFLEKGGVDTSRFGQGAHKTLAEFSLETVRGESSVIMSKAGKVLRMVDLVLLKINNPTTGELLVQTEQVNPNGSKLNLQRLPGGKRRPDESQFLTARRILRQMLRIDEDQVSFDVDGVTHFEAEEEESNDVDYPGIRTTYRTHVVPAQIVVSKPLRNSAAAAGEERPTVVAEELAA